MPRLSLQNDLTDFIEFDNLIEESPSFPGLVTDHPIENGVNAGDHIQPLPQQWNLTVEVTETPDEGSQAFRDGVLAGLSGRQRTVAALTWLEQRRGLPFRWDSGYLRPLANVGILDISTRRNNRGRLLLQIRVKQITLAFSQVVELPPRRIRPQKAKPPGDKGIKSKREINESTEGLKSVLALAEDFFRSSPE